MVSTTITFDKSLLRKDKSLRYLSIVVRDLLKKMKGYKSCLNTSNKSVVFPKESIMKKTKVVQGVNDGRRQMRRGIGKDNQFKILDPIDRLID